MTVARARHSAAQAALSAAKAEERRLRDVLLSFDAGEFPETRYYVEPAASAVPQGLHLLHKSGLLVESSLERDYEVRLRAVSCWRVGITSARLARLV